MELQLGLAPPNQVMKGFDLNSPKEMSPKSGNRGYRFCGNKRNFDETLEMEYSPIRTLNLLWNDQPDDDGGGGDDAAHKGFEKPPSCQDLSKRCIVGWPPIKASRKLQFGGGMREGSDETKGGLVKVKMEGVAIGRKVDLTVHDSYQTLIQTLNNMFRTYPKSFMGNGSKRPQYKLTYEDREGDWMLVGDVPWGTFVQTVQRIKIQKSED